MIPKHIDYDELAKIYITLIDMIFELNNPKWS